MTKIFRFLLWSLLFSITAANADTISKFTLPSGVDVTIQEAAFQKTNFAVEGCSNETEKCRINGRIPFGVASGLPKTYLKQITISFQGRSYDLDISDMYDAWGMRPLQYPGKVRYFGGSCSDVRNCELRGLFSDASGSFVAEWRIVDGLATRTILTDSSDVVALFMKNIDPPKYD